MLENLTLRRKEGTVNMDRTSFPMMHKQLLVILPSNVLSEDYDIIKDLIAHHPELSAYTVVSPQFGPLARGWHLMHEVLAYRYTGYFFLYLGYFLYRLLVARRPVRFSLRWFRGEYERKCAEARDAFFDELRTRADAGFVLPFSDGRYGHYIFRNIEHLLALGKPVYALRKWRTGQWAIVEITHADESLSLSPQETRDRYIDLYGRPRVERLFPGKPEDHFL